MTELVLAIDTSCDETAAAVTCGEWVLSNVVASQVEVHKEFGGVVPHLAKREHQKLIGPVIKEALKQSARGIGDIGAIAVTIGPGLAIALEVGVAKAKELAQKYRKPLIAIDHMEGHLLSAFAKPRGFSGAKPRGFPAFPALGLLVSGGHTELVLMRGFGDYRLIGQTLDDAAGECFDKVARILGLEYPGGPIISKLALEGDAAAFSFPIPMKRSGDLNFSFSGLKTACLYKRRELGVMSQAQIDDFCASFERVVITHLTDKLVLACRRFKPKMVLLGGGVIANRRLQEKVKQEMQRFNIPVHIPCDPKFLTDNAAMIGVAAFYKAKQNEFVEDVSRLERNPNLSFPPLASEV